MNACRTRSLTVLLLTALSAPALTQAQPQVAPGPDAGDASSGGPADSGVLRICADAHNLPQSNDKGEGYENKIAEAMARDFKRKIEYTYFPQRMGFVRNTLRAVDETTRQYKCDLIVGVPKGYELTATTQPYMHSTYAMIVPERAEFSHFKSAADVLTLPRPKLQQLKIGIFAQTPAADWLLKNGLMDHASLYAAQSGDPNENPQSVVANELEAGKIDAAIVWGPVAGFLVSRHTAGTRWLVLPFKPDPTIHFDYEMSMGVRFGEPRWKDMVDQWIGSHRPQINQILSSYHIPLLDENGQLLSARN